jgi:hypothetical protein
MDGALRAWRRVRVNDDTVVELFVDAEPGALHFRVVNKAPSALADLALAVNRNAVGLAFPQPPAFPAALEFGDAVEVRVPVQFTAAAVGNAESADLQIAVRTDRGTVFGAAPIPVELATVDEGRVSEERFRELSAALEVAGTVTVDDARIADEEALAERRVFVVGKADGKMYVSFRLASGVHFVAELAQKGRDVVVTVRAPDRAALALVQQSALGLFGAK